MEVKEYKRRNVKDALNCCRDYSVVAERKCGSGAAEVILH
jgi:hypothetical protein